MSLARRSLHQSAQRTLHCRPLSTESVPSSSSSPPTPPPNPPSSSRTSRTRLMPPPRPSTSHSSRSEGRPRTAPRTRYQALPNLPHNFGSNQLLAVPNTTRQLLERIVAQFNAPIRYAFAYGSGVFEQDGYLASAGNRPMLDFMFAVSHPGHWHSINMARNASHYALHARLFGSDFVSRIQELGPGVWFNPYVTVNGVTIKYGVTSVDTLCSDLLAWRTLYLAGRMHKPLRIIKDDARVRLTQQVNLTSALRAALLTLPPRFTERALFERIAGISYHGDPRMSLPAENRGKVANIVGRQQDQFRDLYRKLALGLPGVHWQATGDIEQDTEVKTRLLHLQKLPQELARRVDHYYEVRTEKLGMPGKEADEGAYWRAVAGHEKLSQVLTDEMKDIVRYPATVQTAKGIVSAGLGKSVRYGAGKISKWWQGSRGVGSEKGR